jgi:hypothetical protein
MKLGYDKDSVEILNELDSVLNTFLNYLSEKYLDNISLSGDIDLLNNNINCLIAWGIKQIKVICFLSKLYMLKENDVNNINLFYQKTKNIKFSKQKYLDSLYEMKLQFNKNNIESINNKIRIVGFIKIIEDSYKSDKNISVEKDDYVSSLKKKFQKEFDHYSSEIIVDSLIQLASTYDNFIEEYLFLTMSYINIINSIGQK